MSNCKSGLKSTEHGFSIIELIAVLCIVAVFVAVAIPSYTMMYKGQQKRIARESFEAYVRRAQAIAMSKNARGVLTSIRSGAIFTFGVDYPPYNYPVANDGVTLRLKLPTNILVTTSSRLIFNSRGQLTDYSDYPTTSNLTFTYSGSTFATATVYSTGAIVFN